MCAKPVFSEIVVQHIKKAVRNGRLLPNQKICEQTLATEIETSRAPVREALNILVGEGILISTAHQGKRINALSAQEISDAYLLGGVMHGVMISACIKKYTKSDIEQMEELIDAMRQTAQHSSYAEDFDILSAGFYDKLMFYPKQRWPKASMPFCRTLSAVLYHQTRIKVVTPQEEYLSYMQILHDISRKNDSHLEHFIRETLITLGTRMAVSGYDYSQEKESKRRSSKKTKAQQRAARI